jgi:ribosomal protein S18 acetylase RimI-like enzyme
MSVEVRAIELPRDAVRFCKTWWPIYADDPHWVPPLLFERKRFLHPRKNPFFSVARVRCFIAYRDGTPVGTIAATIMDRMQEYERGVGLFGFFEFRDDVEVSRALFETAAEWLHGQGMHTLRGPYSLSPYHEFGLRVEGWDTDPALLNPHNREYYAGHYEALGLTGVRDWYAYWGDISPVPERFSRASQRFLDRHPEVEVRHLDMADWDQQILWFWDIYNDAWEHNWGHVRIERDEALALARGLKPMVDQEFVWWAFVDGKPAAAAIAFLDYNQVVKKMNGKLLPVGWYHWLFGRRKIDALRIFALGVKQQYREMPLGVPLYVKIWEAALARGVRGADGSLVVEDNVPMRSTLEKLGAHIYQTYRIYEHRLDGREVEPASATSDTDSGP